jgi:hypothetical protein
VIDRCCAAKAILIATVILLIATWIYPPWVHYGRYQRVTPDIPHGWFFILDTNQRESDSEVITRIDLGRLLLIDAVLTATGGAIAYVFSRRSAARPRAVRITASGLCAVTIALALWTAGLVAQQTQQAIARHNAELKSTEVNRQQSNDLRNLIAAIPDLPMAQQVLAAIEEARRRGNSDDAIYNRLSERFKGFVPIKEIPGLGYKLGNGDNLALRGLTGALTKDALRVQADDLKKIILFDVQFTSAPPFTGRIRNDLPQVVRNVVLRGSFYDSRGQLVEVRNFPLASESYQPGVPVSFTAWASGNLGQIQSDYRYTLELAEAVYEQMPVQETAKNTVTVTADEFLKEAKAMLRSGQPNTGLSPHPVPVWKDIVSAPQWHEATPEQRRAVINYYADRAASYAKTLPGAANYDIDKTLAQWRYNTLKAHGDGEYVNPLTEPPGK